MKYKLVPINTSLSIPVPLGLSSEQEAEVVARFRAENPPDVPEAERHELEWLLQHPEKLIPMEQVLQELGIPIPPDDGCGE